MSSLFDYGREGFLGGQIDWDTATIKLAMIRGYTPNFSTHQYMSSVSGTVLATATLTGKTIIAGVADAADVNFPAPVGDGQSYAGLIYQASAVTGGADVAASAQRLIAYLDAGDFPVTNIGLPFVVQWSASGIFRL